MTEEELAYIMYPTAIREMQRVKDNSVRFVHYTSADTAIKILRGGAMWLRNSVVMNDFSEVKHGLHCLRTAWASEHGARLKAVLNNLQPDLDKQVEALFDDELPHIENETYLTSISEHDPAEDIHGRLSMWRAYAAKDGVALVLRNCPFISDTNPFNAFTSPVVYADEVSFMARFAEIADGFERNAEALKSFSPAGISARFANVLRFAVQSTKHPAFREEREWRVIFTPTLLIKHGQLTEEQTIRLPTEITTVSGVPQRIYKLLFRNYPEEGFVGASIPELIERVIIGPSMDALLIARAFLSELTSAGIADAANRVVVSGIPLRH